VRGSIGNITEKCVGCNRCVRVCPIDEANITREKDGAITVEVDGSKCIICGSCLTACRRGGAR
jgi:formate hydrogenlyase subunit 6/NADH:ubiquinone oxidoreductase subunit I